MCWKWICGLLFVLYNVRRERERICTLQNSLLFYRVVNEERLHAIGPRCHESKRNKPWCDECSSGCTVQVTNLVYFSVARIVSKDPRISRARSIETRFDRFLFVRHIVSCRVCSWRSFRILYKISHISPHFVKTPTTCFRIFQPVVQVGQWVFSKIV
jgi:hypothetical protein